MIKHFKDRETKNIFNRVESRVFPTTIQKTAYRKLLMLDAAISVLDLRVPPGNHLERLDGTRASQYSIRINNQWRLCFTWQEGDAYNVEIVDYH